MLAPSALVKGIVAKLLPSPFGDDRDLDKPMRVTRYGEQVLQLNTPPTRHGLSEEGSYLIATNPTIDTGQAWVAAQTAFSDTAPNFYIYNPENAASSNAKSIYLDYLKLIATAVATSAVSVRYAFVLDTIARALTTDNTQTITPVNPNGNVSNLMTPVIKVQNNATASVIAASSSAKRIVGQGVLGGLPAIGDTYKILFGHPDTGMHSGLTAAQATAPRYSVDSTAPIIIGPGQSLTMHLWMPSSAATFTPVWEMGMWVR